MTVSSRYEKTEVKHSNSSTLFIYSLKRFHIQVSMSFYKKENGENKQNKKCGKENEYFPTNENKEIISDEEDDIIITESILDIFKYLEEQRV